MNLIEEAAKRLEQLQRAGVEVPEPATEHSDGSPGSQANIERIPTPERVVQALRPEGQVEVANAVRNTEPSPAAPQSEPTDGQRRSKLVNIDLKALAQAGYLTSDAQNTQLAHEFRVLKRPIIKNASNRSPTRIANANRVMVTSALPGEGKTYFALNLALSIALEVDNTVLLVDADVAKPSLMKVFHLPSSKGLLDLLSGDRFDLSDVLLRTNIEKLSLLPAGTAHSSATEMLASAAMEELVDEMSSRYADRIIVFDSPPLLPTTEARVLASHMGQIVMVIEADRTSRANVSKALETIENCPVVLMALNKVAKSEAGAYYSYGSAYGGAYGTTG